MTELPPKSRLTNGYAISYYGQTDVGVAVHNSKYVTHRDFPSFIVEKAIKLLSNTCYATVPFDLILYVPPTVSGTLVKNFATQIANKLNIPISDQLKKVKNTQEQKMYNSYKLKEINILNAFDIDSNIVLNKTILLIDDVYDSGKTIAEIGNILTRKGAQWIVPLVIAKTVGGTDD